MAKTDLVQKKCVPCEGGTPALGEDDIKTLMEEIPEWKLRDDHLRISRMFSFPHYLDAIPFVKKIAETAEKENHHPDIRIGYKKVTVTCMTHAQNGLSENDFIIAAKIDQLLSK